MKKVIFERFCGRVFGRPIPIHECVCKLSDFDWMFRFKFINKSIIAFRCGEPLKESKLCVLSLARLHAPKWNSKLKSEELLKIMHRIGVINI